MTHKIFMKGKEGEAQYFCSSDFTDLEASVFCRMLSWSSGRVTPANPSTDSSPTASLPSPQCSGTLLLFTDVGTALWLYLITTNQGLRSTSWTAQAHQPTSPLCPIHALQFTSPALQVLTSESLDKICNIYDSFPNGWRGYQKSLEDAFICP